MFHVECVDGWWHVCRGDLVLSLGYREKRMAERELAYKQREEYRLLVGVEGAYHPQWRWSSEWSWTHFKHKVNNTYVVFKSFTEAERFMTEQGIEQYEIVQEERK